MYGGIGWTRLFPGLPGQVAAVRGFVRSVLQDHADVWAVELVASELATNAILHTASGKPDGWFVVQVGMTRGLKVLNVYDLGAEDEPAMYPLPAADAGVTEHGRGLHTLAALAKEWGVEDGGNGRAVWVVF